MLFEGNREIAGRYFERPLGILKEGAAGDVIVADYIPRTPMDASNVNSHIVFGLTGRSVVTTVCNGRILMKDRELIGVDEEKVQTVIDIIKAESHSRKQMIPTTTEMSYSYIPTMPVEVRVGGATIFVVDVERFERL